MSEALKPIKLDPSPSTEKPRNLFQSPETRLMVALDFSDPNLATALVDRLKGIPVIYKVGFELLLAGGREFVARLVDAGNSVFWTSNFMTSPIR